MVEKARAFDATVLMDCFAANMVTVTKGHKTRREEEKEEEELISRTEGTGSLVFLPRLDSLAGATVQIRSIWARVGA